MLDEMRVVVASKNKNKTPLERINFIYPPFESGKGGHDVTD